MFDIRLIRENPDAFDAGMARRGLPPSAAELIALDEVRRAAHTEAQEIQTRRNALSKEIGAAKAKGEDASELLARVSADKAAEGAAEAAARQRSPGRIRTQNGPSLRRVTWTGIRGRGGGRSCWPLLPTFLMWTVMGAVSSIGLAAT